MEERGVDIFHTLDHLQRRNGQFIHLRVQGRVKLLRAGEGALNLEQIYASILLSLGASVSPFAKEGLRWGSSFLAEWFRAGTQDPHHLALIPALLLTSCVTVGKLLNYSEPWAPPSANS